MTTGLGLLRWSEEQFWLSSYYPYSCAINGYLASKGVKTDSGVMTRGELLDLIAEDEKAMKSRRIGN